MQIIAVQKLSLKYKMPDFSYNKKLDIDFYLDVLLPFICYITNAKS